MRVASHKDDLSRNPESLACREVFELVEREIVHAVRDALDSALRRITGTGGFEFALEGVHVALTSMTIARGHAAQGATRADLYLSIGPRSSEKPL